LTRTPNRGFRTWLAALAVAALPVLSVAQELNGSFASGKAPYLWTEGTGNRGAELDIVSAVLRRAGYGVQIVTMPKRRLMAEFPDSNLDFTTGLQLSDLPGYCHTAIYMSYHNVAITLRARHIALDSVPQLLNYRVAIRQYLYEDLDIGRPGSGMPASLPANFTEFHAQDQQVRFFYAGRSDVIVLDHSIFQWYARRLGLLSDKKALDVHDIFPERHGVRAAFRDNSMCALFDRNLAAIVADGTYRSIWKSYDIEGNPDPSP